jgi:Rrf2 family protein
MVFSKSFGYALRGILYVSAMNDENRRISIDEMAEQLAVPRYFLGKIMKNVVKSGIIDSTRGQQGGFFINKQTLQTPLSKLVLLMEGREYFQTCILNFGHCNAVNPCPLHSRVEKFRAEIQAIYHDTTIGDLLKSNKPSFIKSIATIEHK